MSNFQKIILFFQHFVIFSRELIYVTPNFFPEKLPKRHSTCSKEILEGKSVFFEETKTFFPFRTFSEKNWSFGGDYSAGLSKLISTQLGNVLKNNFISDRTIFFIVSGHTAKFFGLLVKQFGWDCQKSNLPFR